MMKCDQVSLILRCYVASRLLSPPPVVPPPGPKRVKLPYRSRSPKFWAPPPGDPPKGSKSSIFHARSAQNSSFGPPVASKNTKKGALEPCKIRGFGSQNCIFARFGCIFEPKNAAKSSESAVLQAKTSYFTCPQAPGAPKKAPRSLPRRAPGVLGGLRPQGSVPGGPQEVPRMPGAQEAPRRPQRQPQGEPKEPRRPPGGPQEVLQSRPPGPRSPPPGGPRVAMRPTCPR